MIQTYFQQLYENYKLQFYQRLFNEINESEEFLSAFDFYCLETIYLLKNPTISKFSSFINISYPNAAYKIKKLVKKGFIIKKVSDSDKRVSYLQVSDKFLDFYNRNDYRGMFIIDKIVEYLDENKKQQLQNILKEVVDVALKGDKQNG